MCKVPHLLQLTRTIITGKTGNKPRSGPIRLLAKTHILLERVVFLYFYRASTRLWFFFRSFAFRFFFFCKIHYSILIGCRLGLPVVVVDFRTRWLRIQCALVFRREEKLSTPILRLPDRSENIYRTSNRRSKTPADIKRESLAVHQKIKYGCYCFKTTFLVQWQRIVWAAVDSPQMRVNRFQLSSADRTCNYSSNFSFRYENSLSPLNVYKPFVVLHRRV